MFDKIGRSRACVAWFECEFGRAVEEQEGLRSLRTQALFVGPPCKRMSEAGQPRGHFQTRALQQTTLAGGFRERRLPAATSAPCSGLRRAAEVCAGVVFSSWQGGACASDLTGLGSTDAAFQRTRSIAPNLAALPLLVITKICAWHLGVMCAVA
jgi:hypothetical protein